VVEPLLLRNARFPGTAHVVDVLLTEARVASISPARGVSASGCAQLDLDGRYLLPGLWDEHVHFTQWSLVRQRLNLAGAGSAALAAELVRAHIGRATQPSGVGPLIGYGFRDALWPDAPSARLLDDAAQGAPVVLVSADLHCLWLSSAAAELLGVSIDEEGLLREDAAFRISRRLDEVPTALLDSWVADAAAAAAARGVVGIVDLEMAPNHAVWTRRVGQGFSSLRVEIGIYSADLEAAIAAGLRTGEAIAGADDLLSVGPFKVLIDGSLNTRTAYCFDPYPGGSYGRLTVQPAQLSALLKRAAENGLRPAVHAIGDRANRIALDSFEQLGIRGRIEHAQLVNEADVIRFARLGIGASVQPEHAMDDRDAADHHWSGRTGQAFMLRTFLGAGVTLAFGSDAPVTPLDPWLSVATAVTRTRDGLAPWHAEQSISVSAALSSSSRGAAQVTVGQRADLVAIEHDPSTAAGEQLRSMPVALTMVGARVTHSTLAG